MNHKLVALGLVFIGLYVFSVLFVTEGLKVRIMSGRAMITEALGSPMTTYGVDYSSDGTAWAYTIPEAKLRRDFELFKQSKINLISLWLHWNVIQPDSGTQYNDAFLERIKKICLIANEYGIQVDIDFHSGAGDATDYHVPSWVSPRDFSTVANSQTYKNYWINMEKHVVQYLAGVPNIRSYHLFNEVWADTASLQTAYRTLFVDTANAISSLTNKPLSIRFGPSSFINHNWITWEQLYQICAHISLNIYVDVYSGHTISNLDKILTAAKSHGKELEITEYGAKTDGTAASDEQQRQFVANQIKNFKARNIKITTICQYGYFIGEGWNVFDVVGDKPRSAFYEIVKANVGTQTCSADGTAYNSCSSTKPKYCSGGTLSDKCSVCGCPTDYNCNTTTESCSLSSSGPIAYWKLDEGTGATAADSSSYKNNGTLFNSPTWVTGKIGKAISFDGTNDYIQAAHNDVLSNFTQAATFSFWLKPSDISRRQAILNKFNNVNGSRGWFIDTPSYLGNYIGFFASPDGTNYSQWLVPFTPTLGNWYHIAVVWQANTIPKFYINGQPVSTADTALISKIYNNVGIPLLIGKSQYTAGRELNGTLDEIKIWSRALSADEIKSEYGIVPPTIYTLTVTKVGTGSGTVTSSPAGISCGTDCTENYASGTSVTLTAAASSGSTFAGWSGACSGTGTCVLAMSAAKTATATFNLSAVSYLLIVTKAGTGSGTVTSSPAGISCGATCSASYASGTSVTLTAAASSGSTFAGWSGACSGTGTCVLAMSAAKTATATFSLSSACSPLSYPSDKWQRVWYVHSTGACLGNTPDQTSSTFDNNWSTGTIAYSKTDDLEFHSSRTINFPTAGNHTFTLGSDDGARLWVDDVLKIDKWIDRAYTTDSVVLNLTAGNHKLRIDYYDSTLSGRVSFSYSSPVSYALTITKAGAGSGTVTSSPAGISCGSDCTESYASGTSVTLTAAASSGSTFAGWSGACTGTGTCVVAMSAAKTATATFNPSGVSTISAGLRSSPYGYQTQQTPTWWVNTAKSMASKVPGSTPTIIWVLGEIMTPDSPKVCKLYFPSPGGSYTNITFNSSDVAESYLSAFDTNGIKVWLQVEPGDASMIQLIDLVMNRYKNHPSVIGFGVDVEWFYYSTNSSDDSPGKIVTNAEATAWLAEVKKYNPSYKLFLKHWITGKMPSTFRNADLLFIDDSEQNGSFVNLVNEFKAWGSAFSSSGVGFQFGYPSDRPWWINLTDPPKEIANTLISNIPNTKGVYWVDFSITEVF